MEAKTASSRRKRQRRDVPPSQCHEQVPPSRVLDLHGYTRERAEERLRQFLDGIRYEESKHQRSSSSYTLHVTVITGSGKHSPHGPVLRQAVERLFQRRRMDYVINRGRGSFTVDALSGIDMPSPNSAALFKEDTKVVLRPPTEHTSVNLVRRTPNTLLIDTSPSIPERGGKDRRQRYGPLPSEVARQSLQTRAWNSTEAATSNTQSPHGQIQEEDDEKELERVMKLSMDEQRNICDKDEMALKCALELSMEETHRKTNDRGNDVGKEDLELMRAIELSERESQSHCQSVACDEDDVALKRVLELSMRESRRNGFEEEEMVLEQALELSKEQSRTMDVPELLCGEDDLAMQRALELSKKESERLERVERDGEICEKDNLALKCVSELSKTESVPVQREGRNEKNEEKNEEDLDFKRVLELSEKESGQMERKGQDEELKRATELSNMHRESVSIHHETCGKDELSSKCALELTKAKNEPIEKQKKKEEAQWLECVLELSTKESESVNNQETCSKDELSSKCSLELTKAKNEPLEKQKRKEEKPQLECVIELSTKESEPVNDQETCSKDESAFECAMKSSNKKNEPIEKQTKEHDTKLKGALESSNKESGQTEIWGQETEEEKRLECVMELPNKEYDPVDMHRDICGKQDLSVKCVLELSKDTELAERKGQKEEEEEWLEFAAQPSKKENEPVGIQQELYVKDESVSKCVLKLSKEESKLDERKANVRVEIQEGEEDRQILQSEQTIQSPLQDMDNASDNGHDCHANGQENIMCTWGWGRTMLFRIVWDVKGMITGAMNAFYRIVSRR